MSSSFSVCWHQKCFNRSAEAMCFHYDRANRARRLMKSKHAVTFSKVVHTKDANTLREKKKDAVRKRFKVIPWTQPWGQNIQHSQAMSFKNCVSINNFDKWRVHKRSLDFVTSQTPHRAEPQNWTLLKRSSERLAQV